MSYPRKKLDLLCGATELASADFVGLITHESPKDDNPWFIWTMRILGTKNRRGLVAALQNMGFPASDPSYQANIVEHIYGRTRSEPLTSETDIEAHVKRLGNMSCLVQSIFDVDDKLIRVLMALGRYDDKDYSAIRGRWDLGLTDQLIESAALLIRFLFGSATKYLTSLSDFEADIRQPWSSPKLLTLWRKWFCVSFSTSRWQKGKYIPAFSLTGATVTEADTAQREIDRHLVDGIVSHLRATLNVTANDVGRWARLFPYHISHKWAEKGNMELGPAYNFLASILTTLKSEHGRAFGWDEEYWNQICGYLDGGTPLIPISTGVLDKKRSVTVIFEKQCHQLQKSRDELGFWNPVVVDQLFPHLPVLWVIERLMLDEFPKLLREKDRQPQQLSTPAEAQQSQLQHSIQAHPLQGPQQVPLRSPPSRLSSPEQHEQRQLRTAKGAQAERHEEAVPASASEETMRLVEAFYRQAKEAEKSPDYLTQVGRLADQLSAAISDIKAAHSPPPRKPTLYGPQHFFRSLHHSKRREIKYEGPDVWDVPIGLPRGIANVGNTCFLNSAIQCLYATVPLVAHTLESASLRIKFGDARASQVKEQFEQLMLSIEGATPAEVIQPYLFSNAITSRWPNFAAQDQHHDAQELLRLLLSELDDGQTQAHIQQLGEESEETRTQPLQEYANNMWLALSSSAPSEIFNIFAGLRVYTWTCPVPLCSNVENIEARPFLELTLRVPEGAQSTALVDLLGASVEVQTLKRCHSCKNNSMGTQKQHLFFCPPVVVVHLSRTHYDAAKHRLIKATAKVDIPSFLDLKTAGVAEASHVSQGLAYELYAVAEHLSYMKEAVRGHYIAKVRFRDCWYLLDDASPPQVISVNDIDSSYAYILFYRRAQNSSSKPQA